ncbi:uncharacterized protein M421DRAFT_88732 [Didymella exigua CBS 183.55]|uniref:Fatty acid hydroxylase domain-containing protein n=1 Tax=Didymella exigua CBS 183.55 TaxID=1150837 RepID=A0A6A5S7R0_9PLEO|nr:uncharacterized protein M421DRAFT_88732 [Didymella exigua CBS 183.55]KAF1933547.1 hypothetical protein M421DRAFT_88732 [Didymella exigua CBS 183.55]
MAALCTSLTQHWLFGVLIYYVFASSSYFFVFGKATFAHQRYLKNQIKLEMKQANIAVSIMTIFTAPWLLAESRSQERIQGAAQASPQVDYAYNFRLARFPSHGRLRTGSVLPRLLFPLSSPGIRIRRALHFGLIHDGEYAHDSPIINGAACQIMHHLYFNYNYGQFTTLWNRMGGSYRKPNDELFQKEVKCARASGRSKPRLSTR